MLFFSLIIIIFSFSIFESNGKSKLTKSYKEFVFFFIYIILVMIAGFRDIVPTGSFYNHDTLNYIKVFNNIPTNIFEIKEFANQSYMEYGFLFINGIVKLINNNYQLFFFLVSFISMSLIYVTIKRFSNYYLFSILIYITNFYFIRDMNQIRAALAYSIVFYSLKYVNENNIYKYFLYILIATSIHFSALIALPVYFFKKIYLSKNVVIFILFFSIIISKVKILKRLLDINILQIIPFYERFHIYLQYNLTDRGLHPKTLKIIFICFIFVLLRDKMSEKYKLYNVFLNMLLFSVIIASLFHESPVFSVRLPQVFYTVEILVIPYLISLIKQKRTTMFISYLTKTSYAFYGFLYLMSLYEYGLKYSCVLF